MDATEGLVRGQKALDLGTPIRVPVGKATLGRVMNVIGDPIDERGPINAKNYAFIHCDAPVLQDINTEQVILTTGIKVFTSVLMIEFKIIITIYFEIRLLIC